MIHVERPEPPEFLFSGEFERFRKDTEEWFERPWQQRAQESFTFQPLHEHDELVLALYEVFRGKCAFCEQRMPSPSDMWVKHYRPAQGALDDDGTPSPNHYWWLAYEWSNLYASCPDCARYKGKRFPIGRKHRAPTGTQGDELLKERPVLLDPCRDDPARYLSFNDYGGMSSEHPRGHATIETLGLLRADLLERREIAAAVFKTRLDSLAEELIESSELSLLDPFTKLEGEEFGGMLQQSLVRHAPDMKRRLVRRAIELDRSDVWIDELRDFFESRIEAWPAPADEPVPLPRPSRKKAPAKTRSVVLEAFSVNETTTPETATPDSDRFQPIEKIEIHNFKAIAELELEFAPGTATESPWLLLLGENGTGKSSVLQALALTLMGDAQRRQLRRRLGFRAHDLVRHRCRRGWVKVYLSQVEKPLELTLRSGDDDFGGNVEAPQIFLLGFGATRLLPRGPATEDLESRLVKVDNLFDPSIKLADADGWLASRDRRTFNRMARGLRKLLPQDQRGQLSQHRSPKPHVRVRIHNSQQRLKDLSAGYQSVIALAVDIMSVVSSRWPNVEDAEGLVVVDEIGAHLHPSWRLQIVRGMRSVFPRLQFVVSTHDPLCLRGLHDREVVVMSRDPKGYVIAETDLPNPEAMRIDQILQSDYFGLSSTIDPEINELYEEYYQLLRIKNRKPGQERRLEVIKSRLTDKRELGDTERERLMLETIDDFRAERSAIRDREGRKALKQRTRQDLLKKWKKLQQNRLR